MSAGAPGHEGHEAPFNGKPHVDTAVLMPLCHGYSWLFVVPPSVVKGALSVDVAVLLYIALAFETILARSDRSLVKTVGTADSSD